MNLAWRAQSVTCAGEIVEANVAAVVGKVSDMGVTGQGQGWSVQRLHWGQAYSARPIMDILESNLCNMRHMRLRICG
jgi:hypothetical protein